MIPVLFHIGPIPVYCFGAFMALAAVVGGWIGWLELKRYGYDPELSSWLVFAGAIAGPRCRKSRLRWPRRRRLGNRDDRAVGSGLHQCDHRLGASRYRDSV